MNMDSGDKDTLIYAVKTAYEHFPADEVSLILWNHGTGSIEPEVHRSVSPSELFRFNADNNLFELDNSVSFLDCMSQGETLCNEPKGICFDDSNGTYITIEELKQALKIISTKVIKKKINVLACDACLMGGADVFIGFEPWVNYYVASQEVALGAGYRYDLVIDPLISGSMTMNERFAKHMVSSFKEAYSPITQDYTHAAIDLSYASTMEEELNTLAELLIYGLRHQKGKSMRELIRLSKHKHHCTRFNEPTYIDLAHFCKNLAKNLKTCELTTNTEAYHKKLTSTVQALHKTIKESVIANTSGTNLPDAQGVSIYFPEFLVHKSYHRNPFAKKTKWLSLLKEYVNAH